MHGDCLELMALIPDGSVDMILCDLPYGVTACEWDCRLDPVLLWRQYLRVLKPSGAVCLTATQPFTTDLIQSQRKLFRYDLVWNKVNFHTGALMARKRPLRSHETVCVFYRKQPTYNPQWHGKPRIKASSHGKRNGAHIQSDNKEHNRKLSKAQPGAYPGSIIDVPSWGNKTRLHPTQKPVALFEYLIRTYTEPGEVVLDNCFGSGTAAVACIQSGRRFIGIEKDADYFAAAEQRIRDTHRNLFAQEAYDAESIDALAA